MTGGVGIADQWTGNAQDPDHWRDTHVRVRGPIVRGLQGAFAENWLEATGDVLVGPDYLPELEPVADDGAMQVVRSTAEVGDTNVEALYFLAIACARTTPAPHLGVLRAAAGVRRGADRRRAARRRRPRARPRAAHRQGLRPPGGALGLRGAARGRRADLRVLPDDDPRQDADDRRRLVVGRLGELRQPLLPAAGRGDAVRLLDASSRAQLDEQFERDLERSAEIEAGRWNGRPAARPRERGGRRASRGASCDAGLRAELRTAVRVLMLTNE